MSAVIKPRCSNLRIRGIATGGVGLGCGTGDSAVRWTMRCVVNATTSCLCSWTSAVIFASESLSVILASCWQNNQSSQWSWIVPLVCWSIAAHIVLYHQWGADMLNTEDAGRWQLRTRGDLWSQEIVGGRKKLTLAASWWKKSGKSRQRQKRTRNPKGKICSHGQNAPRLRRAKTAAKAAVLIY